MRKFINILAIFLITVTSTQAQTSREDIDASVLEEDKAKIAMMKKDYDTAYAHLKKAIDLDPTNSSFLNSAAYLAMEKQDYDEALALLDKALALDTEKFGEKHGNVASVLNNIGSIYSKMGDKQNAVASYQKAYDIFADTYGEKHPQATFIKGLLDAEKAK